ncbi:tyrosine-type recombinase/integrase [Roseiconus lacunae]|uniref:tyrosine-type recombinase/integrase n=1 Tax=Roseiconus lacunae TaxID=2605694 RepID=UPI0030887F6F|nr:tyrosine-type recombinase/integrase [Stieleria sp. HD01]
MPRKPKPFFRKQTKTWYFSTGGRQFNLGRDREIAFKKFYELMADQESLPTSSSTLYDLSQEYLDWIQANRKPATYDKHKHYLCSFIKYVGRRLKPSALKPFHLTQWSNKPSWNSSSRHDAISIVGRMLNWAVREGFIKSNPIAGIKKPRMKRREIVYTAEQWKEIKTQANGPLADFLDFLWSTGCRPKEARTVEARHVHNDLIIFPPDESKGETDSRVIFLSSSAKLLVQQQVDRYPTGRLFRNNRCNPWTKDAVVNRLRRISKKVGFRVIAYGARHSFATNALIRSVDTVSLSHLMGHKDTRMVNNYAHLAQNVEFLLKQAENASGV